MAGAKADDTGVVPMDLTLHESPTPTFHLAESDLQNIAIIVKLAIQEEVTETIRTMVKTEVKTDNQH